MKTNDYFYAPVKKVPCSSIIPGVDFMSYNNHAVIMDIDGVDTFVNFCSKDYGLLPTYDLFPKIEEALKENFDFEVAYSVRNFGRFYAEYKLKGFNFNIGKKDKIQPIWRCAHSYNSQIVFNGSAGFYRQICTNGLWGLVMEHQVTLSHTINGVAAIVEKVMESISNFVEKAEQEKERLLVLTETKVKVADLEERVKIAIKEAGFYKSVEKEVIERIEVERTVNGLPLTNWLIYNAFNYQLNHSEKLTGAPEDKMKKDRAIFAYLAGEVVEE